MSIEAHGQEGRGEDGYEGAWIKRVTSNKKGGTFWRLFINKKLRLDLTIER